MQESEIARPRERSQRAENRRQVKNENVKMKNEMINRRKQAFQDFTTRESSQFERVQMKMAAIHDEMMNSNAALAVHRADSAPGRGRGRGRERGRPRGRERGRERRGRGQAVSE